jgi:hypothetical protein
MEKTIKYEERSSFHGLLIIVNQIPSFNINTLRSQREEQMNLERESINMRQRRISTQKKTFKILF